MTTYTSDYKKASEHLERDQSAFFNRSSLIFGVSALLSFAYFVTNVLELGILVIFLLSIGNYRKPKEPINATNVQLELKEEFFLYKEMNSSYEVEINYDRVKDVRLKTYNGFPSVQIEIDEQAELGCLNIAQAEELAAELKSRAKL